MRKYYIAGVVFVLSLFVMKLSPLQAHVAKMSGSSFTFKSKDLNEVFTISADGHVHFGKGITPNEAAKQFAKHLATAWPDACPVKEVIIYKEIEATFPSQTLEGIITPGILDLGNLPSVLPAPSILETHNHDHAEDLAQ